MNEILKPNVFVLKAKGTNCDEETVHAFDLAGGKPKTILINEVLSGRENLSDCKILALPGGFANGDDIASGKILSVALTSHLADKVNDFVHHGGLVLGICNGFQVLVRTGLLPLGTVGEMRQTLTYNDSGHFECRWVNLKVEENSKCEFLEGVNGMVSYQVAHGEGKFYAKPDELQKLEDEKMVVFR